MAETVPQLPFANEIPSTPQASPQFSAEDIRSRLNAINNYINTNQPGILAGIKQADADQANYISQFKDYSPSLTPKIEKVQNVVSGNVMSGPNPGLKQVNIPTADYVNALMNKSKIELSTKSDPYYFARPTSFNASKYGLNYDRYYTHPKFKDLGFSIYRDNESHYNANSTWSDDFVRMGKQWFGLAWQGGSGLFKNWGTFGAIGEAGDAAEMENDLSIAMSSKGGAGAWTTNFLGNSAYTMGIMAEIGAEELALAAGTYFTGGVAGGAAAARTGMNLTRLGKSMKIMSETLRNADKAKSFWTAAKGAGTSAFNFINPLTRTTQVGADLFKANSAINRLDNFAKMQKTFGAFYRDMREINAVTAESRLEAGFSQNKVANDALNDFVNRNGRMPNADEAKVISDNALAAAQTTYWANLPAIYFSNRVVLETALAGIPGAKRLMSKSALNSPLFRVIENPNWKKSGGKPVDLTSRGLFDTTKRLFSKEYLKSIPSKFTISGAKSNLGKTVGSGLRYFSANVMEGAQELYQEGVQASAADYYLNKYYSELSSDPFLAGKYDVWASIKKGFGEQIGPQGLDVFASGFLMGGLAGGVQNKIIAPLYRGGMKISDFMNPGQDSYGDYVKSEKERMQAYVDARNSVEMETSEYVNWLDENVAVQRDLQADYERAKANGDTETAEETQKDSLFNHIHTLLQTDKYDSFINQLEDLKQLSTDDLADAFNEDKANGQEIANRLDNALKKAKSIKTRYEAINSKFKNPYNPDLFDRKRDFEGWSRETLGHKAFETAKKVAMFNEYSFDEALEKATNLVTKAGAKGPLGSASARDFSIIYDILDNKISPNTPGFRSVQTYRDLLQQEIEVFSQGTAEEKSLAKRKQTQVKNLDFLVNQLYKLSEDQKLIQDALTDPDAKQKLEERAREVFSGMQIIDESTGMPFKDYESAGLQPDVLVHEFNKDVTWDAYAKYAKNIAELNNVYPIMDELENSFQDLLEFNKARLEAQKASYFVNILADPMSVIQMSNRIAGAMESAKANKQALHEKAFKKFYDMRNMDSFFNDLLGLKAYFDPEQIDEFIKNDKIPDKFIDAGDGSAILPGDPRYNQIIDLIDKYEQTSGRTFSGKPPRQKTEAPKEKTGTEEPEIKTGETPDDTEPGDVTSPLSAYPEDVQQILKDAHQEAMKDGATSDIAEWIKESPDAAAIIKATKRRRRKKVSEELEGEISAENPKSIEGDGGMLLPGKSGWSLQKDGEQYTKGTTKADRVSSLKENPKPEDSAKMNFAKRRGNFLDLILRRFATPSVNTKLSLKDVYVNAKLAQDQQDNTDRLVAFNMTFGEQVEISIEEAKALFQVNVSEGFKDDLGKVLKTLALELKDFTWYTGFPTMQGTLAGKSIAGTPDLVAEKDGVFYIMDFKTSAQSRRLNRSLYDRDDEIQQNAYADLFEQNTGKRVDQMFIINFIVSADEKTNTLNSVELDRFDNVKGKNTAFIEIPRTSVDELKGFKPKTPKATTDIISDDIYKDFVDNNVVPDEVLNSIADKVIKRDTLSPRETAIFNGKTSEINEIIKKKANTAPVKGTIKVDGKVITMEGVPGSIDFTDNQKNTDFDTMMPEITKLLKNWDKDFVNNNLVNYNGQFLFNHEGRVFVLVKVGNFIVPYYFSSSGTSGKAIDWHYVFGVDDVYGWIIKGGVGENGEMVYSKQMRTMYPNAIAELEKIKKEIRTKLAMTPQTRDIVRTQLDRFNLGKTKYTKSLSSIYKGLDVVEKATPDGIETNDNYDYLLNATLGLIGLDKPGVPKGTKPEVKPDTKKVSPPSRFGGKIIWAPAGSIDPSIFEQYDVVNADDVLKEVLSETGFMQAGESFEDANMRLYKSDQKDKIYGEVKRKLNQLKSEGKTIVTQNWFMEKDADVTSRPPLEKAYDKEVYGKKIKANPFSEKEHAQSQEEGWETRINNVERNSNLTVKELFEKDSKMSTPVQNIMQAADVQSLRTIAMMYEASEEDRPKYFYKSDKENNIIVLTPDELYAILAKRGQQLVKRGVATKEELDNTLMEIEQIIKPSEKKAAELTADQIKDVKEVVDKGNDTSDIASSATDINSEAEKKSQKDIDDEFKNSIGCD